MKKIYVKLIRDKDTGKKEAYFGNDNWGDLKKKDANTVATLTGNGLMVVDVDTKKLKNIDKKLVKLLGQPTVETANGYHYYFTGDVESVKQTQGIFDLVDIRNRGGLVFSEYWGGDDSISYKVIGEPTELTGKLRDYLIKASKARTNRDAVRVGKLVDIDGTWGEISNGEIHSTILALMIRDFKDGARYDDVWSKSIMYIDLYLNGNHSLEDRLFKQRINDTFDMFGNEAFGFSKKKSTNSNGGVSVVKKLDTEEDRIKDELSTSAQKGALDLEVTMRKIKDEKKISIGTQKEMLKEIEKESNSLSKYFKGNIIWDSDIGHFAEVGDRSIRLYSKGNFIQTVMSVSGWMKPSDVSEVLSDAEHSAMRYRPSMNERYFKEGGESYTNAYYGVVLPKNVRECPPLINKVIDNVFLSEPKAKENFINWLAYVVQERKRTSVAWGFFGVQGSGKGIIVDLLKIILGADNCAMQVSDTQLQSSFNNYMHNKLFVHLNEVASDFHGRHGVAGKIKIMVSDNTLTVNRKNMPEVNVENYANIILNSNKPNPIELDADDRRWNMIVSEKALKHYDWWDNVNSYSKCIESAKDFGGWLMSLKVNKKKALKLLELNGAKKDMIEMTTSSLQQLSTFVNQCDNLGLTDLLDISESSLLAKELEWSCKNKRFSNSILNTLVGIVLGDDSMTTFKQRRLFTIPYIKGVRGYLFKNIVGVAVKGVRVGELPSVT